jgi:nucleotide-binding universal stress UspA family protein
VKLDEIVPRVNDDRFVEEVEKSDLPVLVLFRSVWSAPSRSTLFALEEVAREQVGKLRVVQIDMMDNWLVADRFRIRSTPTLLFLERGREVARYEGMANTERIRELAARVLDELGRRGISRARKILVALDADPMLEPLLRTLGSCVRLEPEDEVVLLHALPVFPLTRSAEEEPGWAAMVRAAHQSAENVLSRSARQLSDWNIRATTRRVEGHPAEEILSAARELAADLVLIGALAPRDRDPMPIGSVSEKVKAHAQADVLIVRDAGPYESGRFRALLAVDGSQESLAAVDSFVRKLRADRADIVVVHVIEPGAFSWVREQAPPEAGLKDALRQRADLALSSALGILKSHRLSATTEVCQGRAAVEILRAASRHDAQLIVTGSRGLSGLRSLWLGSVTQRVVRHASASVLVAREQPAAGSDRN